MTPDLVAELLRQLMKEAMILCAPVLWHGAPDLSHDGPVHARWMGLSWTDR